MTSPIETITVDCPECSHRYKDWHRGSVNLNLDDFDEDYMKQCSTATCPKCGTVVDIGMLVVEKGSELGATGVSAPDPLTGTRAIAKVLRLSDEALEEMFPEKG